MPKLVVTKISEKEFAKLPQPERKKVLKKLKSLESNPFSGKSLKGQLTNFYSIRAWPYRIIYEFRKKDNTVIIHKIQNRQGVYK